ncbi:T-cell immunomodulatory protein-like [Salminus brasiliensis]|uniref:T-cell immunomodulatory protein-like n=1 Tax=Salminus brasiliensis TaxID=930266 RepID=UPI003B830478
MDCRVSFAGALGSGLWTLDSGLWTLGSGLWTLDSGLWALGSGLWALGSGLWALGSGLWALGSGLWALLGSVMTVTPACDLFLSTEQKSELGFETWINTNGSFTRNHSGKAPENVKKVGQSAFVDFDGDGSQDHLLPVCMDEKCVRSAIYLAKPNHAEWVPVLTDFQRKETLWGFVPPDSSSGLQLPITLHLGDYNLDGFPDALAILRNTSKTRSVLNLKTGGSLTSFRTYLWT